MDRTQPQSKKMMQSGHSDTVTEGIRVEVAAQYSAERSEPEKGIYGYVYRVRVQNNGDEPVRLLARHWIIKDSENGQQEVTGAGVVGQQPRLEPGSSFEYMSGCPLHTPWGTMEGSYTMERDDGSMFDVKIGRFFLAKTTEPIPGLKLE